MADPRDGADVSKRKIFGETPQHSAGFKETVELLIRYLDLQYGVSLVVDDEKTHTHGLTVRLTLVSPRYDFKEKKKTWQSLSYDFREKKRTWQSKHTSFLKQHKQHEAGADPNQTGLVYISSKQM